MWDHLFGRNGGVGGCGGVGDRGWGSKGGKRPSALRSVWMLRARPEPAFAQSLSILA